VRPQGLSAGSLWQELSGTSQMASKDTYERISFDIVAAARATFESGRRREAIELLRRFDLGKGRAVVAEALHELMIEHQRLLEQEQRAVREAVGAHVKVAHALLEGGQFEEAWSRACDAITLDPSNQEAIALEVRVRKILDERAGQRFVPEVAAVPKPERDEARREPSFPPSLPRPEPRIPAPASPQISRTWIIAVMVMLAVMLIAMAMRTC
jgi:hypothetical protein